MRPMKIYVPSKNTSFYSGNPHMREYVRYDFVSNQPMQACFEHDLSVCENPPDILEDV